MFRELLSKRNLIIVFHFFFKKLDNNTSKPNKTKEYFRQISNKRTSCVCYALYTIVCTCDNGEIDDYVTLYLETFTSVCNNEIRDESRELLFQFFSNT